MAAKRGESRGICEGCQKEIAKRSMAKHVMTCAESLTTLETKDPKPGFHLVIEAKDDPRYWLHLEAPRASKLAELDKFLRNIWLECCGHLSAFEFEDLIYTRNPEAIGFGRRIEKGLNTSLMTAFKTVRECGYIYDYGTSTRLTIRVIGVREKAVDHVRLLAQNKQPVFKCEQCENNKTAIAVVNEEFVVCEDCAKGYEEEEYLLLLNSPRAGVCAYGT